jgi:hypothetical protein
MGLERLKDDISSNEQSDSDNKILRNDDNKEESDSEKLLKKHQLLRQTSSDIQEQIWILRQKDSQVQIMIEENRHALMNICDHDWVFQPPMYQETASYSCKKCGNSKK